MDDIQISVQDTAARLQSESPPRLLDIREPAEWDIVHLPDATLATPEAIQAVLTDWPKDTEIVCYCHHGMRSLNAAMYLKQQGFTNVLSMQGGIEAWAVQIDPSLPRY